MPSTYTTRARLEKQAAGENLATWGDPKLNNDLNRVDYAVKGLASFALSGSITLTSSNTSTDPAQYQAIAAVLNVTSGTGGTITVPSVEGVWLVRNAASGPVSITTGSGATAVIAAGDTASAFSDGTGVYRERQTDFGGLRLTNLGLPVDGADAVTKTYADNLAFSSSLPNQTGNNGKYLTTNGTSASWNALGNAAFSNFGTTNGTVAAGNDGRFTSIAATANAAMPKTGGTFTGPIAMTSGSILTKEASGTPEGGQLNFQRPDTSTLTADIAIDVYAQGIRFFEQGGLFRGITLDFDGLPSLGSGIFFWHSNNLNPALKADLAAPALTGNATLAGEKLVRVASGTAANSGRISFGTGAPGTLALGEIYLQHA